METIKKTLLKLTSNPKVVNIPEGSTVDLLNKIKCSKCRDFGQIHPIVDGHVDYGVLIPCDCQKQQRYSRRMELLMKNCSLPPFATNMTIDKFRVYPELKETYKIVKDIALNHGKLFWLALIGDNGNGKTHLGISIVQSWLKSGVASHYELVSIMLDELREGYRFEQSGDYNLSYSRKFDYYCNVPLLLLDDYGIEKKNDWGQEKLDTIVDYRLMNNLSLIITSNLPFDDFSPRVRSRMARHPNGNIININAVDYALRDNK
jgi:DNA replication protein DnaC